MNNFVIVSELRTGYQMLATLLNSNNKLFCFGEIFGSDRNVRRQSLFNQKVDVIEENDDPVKYVSKLNQFGKQRGILSIGFKLNYVCARKDNWKSLWDYIVADDWKIIHLKRKNLLNRYLSQQLAEKHKAWQFKEYTDPIVINPNHFLFCENQSLCWQKEADQFFKKNQVLNVYYEELTDGTQRVAKEVQEFLGVKPHHLTTPMKKQRTKGQSYLISNYRELCYAVRNSKPECLKYFEDLPMI